MPRFSTNLLALIIFLEEVAADQYLLIKLTSLFLSASKIPLKMGAPNQTAFLSVHHVVDCGVPDLHVDPARQSPGWRCVIILSGLRPLVHRGHQQGQVFIHNPATVLHYRPLK